jgi:hypothetical protein
MNRTISNRRDAVVCLELLSRDYEIALKANDNIVAPVTAATCYRLRSDFGEHIVCKPNTGPRPRFDLYPDIPLSDFVGHVGRYLIMTCFNTSKTESCGLALIPFSALRARLRLRTAEKEDPQVDPLRLPQLDKVNT